MQRDGGRFYVLDAMRGLAAYIVVLHHAFAQWMGNSPLQAGFLAVDFFFVLSGFVMSQAYEERFRNGLGFESFAHARLRRLVPTMLIGVLLGAVFNYVTFHDFRLAATLFFLAAIFLPLLGAHFGIYPLDGVQWSLFFELAANAAHGSILWRLGARALLFAALLSFTVLTFAVYFRGNVAVGDTTSTFVFGFPRVGFSYLTGILLYRFRGRLQLPSIRAEVPAIGLLVLILAVSFADGWGTEMVALLAMPPLVLAGSFATSSLPRLCDYLGRLSFPIYAVHLPILYFCAHLPHVYRIGVELALVTVAAALVELLIRRVPGRRRRRPQLMQQPYLGMS